jgi:hypothetical protein
MISVKPGAVSTLSYPLCKLACRELFRGEKVIYGRGSALLVLLSCGLLYSWLDGYFLVFLQKSNYSKVT